MMVVVVVGGNMEQRKQCEDENRPLNYSLRDFIITMVYSAFRRSSQGGEGGWLV